VKKNAPFSRTNVTNASRGYSSSAPVRETQPQINRTSLQLLKSTSGTAPYSYARLLINSVLSAARVATRLS